MYKGIFVGEKAKASSKKILILGESHHWDTEDYAKDLEFRRLKENNYFTYDVVKRYLENYSNIKNREKCYRFFDNIVKSFGIDPEANRAGFWSNVYFGNYVEQLCGVGDSQAKIAIRNNRGNYNTHLIEFINQENIDYVFCYSFLTYNNLPPLNYSDGDEEISEYSGPDCFTKCIYNKGKKEKCETELNHRVLVFKIHHPSRGFNCEKYATFLKKEMQKECLKTM